MSYWSGCGQSQSETLTPKWHSLLTFRYRKEKHISEETRLLFQQCLVIGLSAAAAAKSLQSCPTLCDPVDGSLPGSPVPGILQARTLEWVAISFSNAWKWEVKVKSLSRVWLFVTPWTAAHQASLSMEFSRQEYWSGKPFLSLRDSSQPRDQIWVSFIAGSFFTIWATREAQSDSFSKYILLYPHVNYIVF